MKLIFSFLLCFFSTLSVSMEVIPSDSLVDGAAAYSGSGNHKNSPYFKSPDFYNMRSSGSLSIIEKFETFQQTTEYTCGPASVVMVANHLDVAIDEMVFARKAGTTIEKGTSTEQLVTQLKKDGFKVRSSLTEPLIASRMFLQVEVQRGNPVLVEWIDWGGHWAVVIGYDDMGTSAHNDDVLILADPYDTTDHNQDGYRIVPAERFESMWFDHNLLPEGMQERQWIILEKESPEEEGTIKVSEAVQFLQLFTFNFFFRVKSKMEVAYG